MFTLLSRHSGVLCALVLASSYTAQAETETVLHRFSASRNGYDLIASLVAGRNGKLYGISNIGGVGYGTVFELSPSAGGWNYTTIHTFHEDEGNIPQALVADGKGNLYGSTALGGANNHGILFKLSPSEHGWVETILSSFGVGAIGVVPCNNLIIDAAGNLYGTDTTIADGESAWSEGVFEASPSDGYAGSIIYDSGVITASEGGGGLTMDSSGNIFGVSYQGYSSRIASAFELSPNGSGGWNSQVIYTFPRDVEPEGPPVLDRDGNLFGTTIMGGDTDNGTVYELLPGSDGTWTRKVLYSFKGGKTDGASPNGSIAFDAAGNIYSTTFNGGTHNAGTVFELATDGHGGYAEKVLWSFNGVDGLEPQFGVILDGAGNIYGTAQGGGHTGCPGDSLECGVVFEISP